MPFPQVNFRNPVTHQDEPLCDAYLSQYAKLQAATTLAVFLVVVMNEVFKAAFSALVEFEVINSITPWWF